MGGVCEKCIHDKDNEFSITRAVTVPVSLKPKTFYIRESPIESEFSSTPMLSLPSISPNSSFQSTSTPKSSNIIKSNQIRANLAIEIIRNMNQYDQTLEN